MSEKLDVAFLNVLSIVRSYLTEIGRGLYMPLFSVSLSANETKMVCYSILLK